MKKDKSFALGVWLAALTLYSSGAHAGDKVTRPPPVSQYNYQEACNLSVAIQHIARKALLTDSVSKQHIKDVSPETSISPEFIFHVYVHNGIFVKYAGAVTNGGIWNVTLQASVIPAEMSAKTYYLTKLGVTGLDALTYNLSVGCDAYTITVRFDGDQASVLSLEANPGAE